MANPLPLVGKSIDPNTAGVLGEGLTGVYGRNPKPEGKGNGVIGYSDDGRGVWGHSKQTGDGVLGESANGRGVAGTSETNYGIQGHSRDIAGIRGDSDKSRGVEGWSKDNDGVWGMNTGETRGAAGVHGASKGEGIGVFGESANDDGVRGVSTNGNGVSAFGGNTGVYAKGPVNAGFFEGNIHVTGNITAAGDIILANADCAEDFNVSATASIEPGTVMVLGNGEVLLPSCRAYDKRVAGVISGAGNYKPGIVLDKQDSQQRRLPVALLGKVFCKVDAQFGPIEVGDLLTTSPTAGHAMRVDDPLKAFGAVIGKALRPLTDGQGLIPILIALQ
jgi:hypothetical protein